MKEQEPLLAVPSSATASTYPIIAYDVQLSHPEHDRNSPPYFRDSPLQILRYDLALILRHASEIPYIFLPLPHNKDKQRDVKFIGIVMQVLFVVVSLVVTGAMIMSFAVGFPTPVLVALVATLVMIGMSKLQGQVRHDCPGVEDKFEDEAWLL